MKISYQWLQNYFDKKLPEPEALADLLTFSFAEIEGIEKKGDDTIFDIKVLPDRACYALSHRGVAYEVSAITGLPKKEMNWPAPPIDETLALSVTVEASDLCDRYTARVIESITQKEMPWITEHLEAVGQRSINPIVDGANIVMFDMGQPLHAFDRDKVKGGITVRRAKKGEELTTLDNRTVSLDETLLIIADDEGPLALAGIKGGKRAEVTAETKNLILESAHFNSTYVRQASARLCLKTEASRRFENNLSPIFTETGLSDFSALLFEMDKNMRAGKIVDWQNEKSSAVSLHVKKEEIERKIGILLSVEEIESIFSRLDFSFKREKDEWIVTPLAFRKDITIHEDITEEVARIIGYDKIAPVVPPIPKEALEVEKAFYYEWKVREILVHAGFSEIMASSFSSRGDVAIEKPLAEDKKYARPNLRNGFEQALKINALNAPLFESDEVRLFEIGRVFPHGGEYTALAIGVAGPKKRVGDMLAEVRAVLREKFGINFTEGESETILECNLDIIVASLPLPKEWDIEISPSPSRKFTPFSLYPFIVRDVALFVTPSTTPDEVAAILKTKATSLLMKGPTLFDDFKKGEKRSLAFRMIFQSMDRTLSDGEVNGIMEEIYSAVKEKGWEVR